MVLKPPSGFRYDKTKDGWVLVEDVLLTGEPTLSLSGFLEEGESSVLGEVMLERGKANKAGELGPLAGQHHAEALLVQFFKCPRITGETGNGCRRDLRKFHSRPLMLNVNEST